MKMTADKKQTLNQVLEELGIMDNNLREFSKAISDCAEASSLRELCLEAILSARANLRKADIYLDVLKVKQ